AEGGIRDFHVTGVQTCALPIYLAPLAHLFLPLIGLGQVYYKGEIAPAREILQVRGMPPLQLAPKEGLALINGTQFIAAHAVHGRSEERRVGNDGSSRADSADGE